MNREELFANICKKRSMLCVGLDVDCNKLPAHLKPLGTFGSITDFNKAIVDATAEHCVAYKPNLAFYEAYGLEGMRALDSTVAYIKDKYPDIFLIADAKRGDIGNTAKMYAKSFFETMDFDAVTVAPYMGADSVTPFLEYKGKWAIVLALTSNPSAYQFQSAVKDGKPLYRAVMEEMMEIGTPDNMMFVVGATKADKLKELRSFCPDNFFLVPGVGAQGGSAEEVMANGSNDHGGLLINSSRGILYASGGEDFAAAAGIAAANTASL
ncbi:MAG: orotidine-5'-phosphate decarboxylase [Bacteroidales bacterium]|nr:orotidine-5'-phosphate decarboxylase [Bacteroidales bacterium]